MKRAGVTGMIGLAVALVLTLAGSRGYAQKGPLVVVSWGGAYQAAERQAVFEPFQKETGVRIVEQSPTDYGKLKAMVQSGNVEWDVVDADCDFVPRGAREGLLEKLDYRVIDKTGTLPEMVHEYGVGYTFTLNAIAYNTKKYPSGKAPRSWADFWDVARFPGPRGMMKYPVTVLEAALLADGVPKDKLYPLDVDRAFRSLDRIKPHITLWWETGAQFAQALTDEEVFMTFSWSGRVSDIKKKGAPVDQVYNEGILTGTCWVIPKGARNRDLAMKFIAFASRPERQAGHAVLINNPPANTRAYQFIPPERARELATAPEHLPKMVILDADWWLGNFDKVNERFNTWLLKK